MKYPITVVLAAVIVAIAAVSFLVFAPWQLLVPIVVGVSLMRILFYIVERK